MKANKALKRLAKIEALMSDVVKRFSAEAPHIRGILGELKATVVRVKEAVKAQATAEAAKKKAKAEPAFDPTAKLDFTDPEEFLAQEGRREQEVA